jgi:capsular polysaccharide biosynthesis protein
MDLVEYGRVIRRQLVVITLGFVITFTVVLLALVRVSADGLALRSPPVYGARSELLVTQPSFPWGRASASPDVQGTAQLENFAGVYASLATSKTVRGIIRTDGKPLSEDAYDVTQLLGASGRTLPIIEVVGKGASEREAVAISNAVATALQRFILANQQRSGVPPRQRVNLRVVTRADEAEVLQGVKLTTPILLFLLGSVVTLVFAFARDNLARHRSLDPASARFEPVSRPAVGFESGPDEPAAVPRATGRHRSSSRHAQGPAEGP